MAQANTDQIDKIPLERRAKAFQLNDEGWSVQMKAIERHVAQAK